MTKITGPSWGPRSKEAPNLLVVMCHGVAATGYDLIQSAPALGKYLPDAVFVAPDAPEICEKVSFGRQWFPIDDLNPAVLASAVRRASAVLNAFIDEQLALYNLPPTAYALMGFSQGAMTALFTGLRRADSPRAILSFSGAHLANESLRAEIKNRMPVLLGHGEMDRVIPSVMSVHAATQLRAANVPVETIFLPKLAHSMDKTLLEAGALFLQKAVFPPASAESRCETGSEVG